METNEERKDGQKQETDVCEPGCGCSCGTGGGGARMKWVICGLVVLAAIVTVATHVTRTTKTAGQTATQGYAATIPAVAGQEIEQSTTQTDVWAAPLKALTDLNVVATNTDGVFVVLPSNDAERMETVRKEVVAAAATISARGSRMGKFILSQNSQEYATLAQQVGTPAVLAMCKGLGMTAVPDKEVTQGNLLKAFISASRPSGCGPSGCGPGGAGCGPTAPDCQ